MQHDISRRQLLGGGSLGTLGALAGCLATGRGATETVTETYERSDLSSLALATVNGAITVDGNQGDAIEVTADKAAPTEDALESVTLESSRRDGQLTLETNFETTPFLFGPDPKVDLAVTVPSGIRLARAETTNGDIETQNVTGDFVAGTTNGRIDAEGVDGGLSAETTNGEVHAAGVSSDVDADTTNGDIDITLADGGDLTAESTNGEITVQAPESLDATVSIETTNGDISVEGFSDSNASSDGSLEMTLGDGTRRLRLETINSDVTFRSTDAP
ncbi:putative adhesin [Natrinema hispanicum]|uniref:Putative adhesin n=1 Tax=Natrinema hispanicum TaxID=392421 RepID=A0A482Y8Y8_9EURY|nr:DUF4097 family beta strand repeat-containing protein [Natrinema hispanicum]RZV08811.1 putative adhesin [Natrinema hispanicum]